ncbi:MAG TPA: bifunctional hydroxymethylpyrimidine kinase/phosphomethylpyrimidine kinase [Candidatus Thermoplasmatota archaeon]|nr:bifunctional hydroxymethylpyrimidine kinase/phosphomethylpyrimidine kinase [Candidatus Thermoplasmatota archaeon]
MERKVALTIAGSDPSGGAGIQADLKAFSYLGVHGTTVITCVTSQNTQRVTGISKVPSDVIQSQLESILDDIPIAAVKTGMLYDADIVKLVSQLLAKHHLKPVVDPVMVATSGDRLSDASFVSSLKQYLLPHAHLITANAHEASMLAGIPVGTQQDAKDACKTISSFGCQFVLVKGGHLTDEKAVDILYDGKRYCMFSLPRLPVKKAHGSGCTLSALITGLLALGEPMVDAVQKAKHITWAMIQEGYAPGKGSDVLDHASRILVPPAFRDDEQFEVWVELKTMVRQLLALLPVSFVPEVGMNVVYATANIASRNDVCGINGRITKCNHKPQLCGSLGFGASKHIASVVLAAHSVNPTVRSALNIRYSKQTVDACKTIGLVVGTFDRRKEPASASSTMEWGTKQAIAALGRVPDVVYDEGGVGKEPMIRILGKNPADVLTKLKKLISASNP